MSKGHSLNLGTIENLLTVHQMIEKRNTGGLYSFARKMHLGPTTLQRRLDALRGLGAEIMFDKECRSYLYLNNFKMVFKVTTSDD